MFLKFFILIVALLITLVSCKILPNIDKSFLRNRILNGRNTEIGEAPYIVLLRSTPNDIHSKPFCGGSIISKSVILTAAYCLERTSYVVAGMHKQDNETGTQLVKVKKKIGHEKYDGEAYDIALLFLENPLEFNMRVQPIELPKVDSDVTGEGQFFGWGLIDSGSPNILQVKTTNIFPDAECKASLNMLSLKHSNVLCTLSYLTTACDGDSGGSLVKSIDGNPILVGIISHGSIYCSDLYYPSVFTNTQSYLEWINDNVPNLI